MDCTMCGAIDCSDKQQCIFIPGEITPLHFYCEDRFVFPALLLKLLRRRAIGGTMNFFPKITPPPWKFVMLAVSSIHRSQVSNAKHGCWTDRETCVFPALQLTPQDFIKSVLEL